MIRVVIFQCTINAITINLAEHFEILAFCEQLISRSTGGGGDKTEGVFRRTAIYTFRVVTRFAVFIKTLRSPVPHARRPPDGNTTRPITRRRVGTASLRSRLINITDLVGGGGGGVRGRSARDHLGGGADFEGQNRRRGRSGTRGVGTHSIRTNVGIEFRTSTQISRKSTACAASLMHAV